LLFNGGLFTYPAIDILKSYDIILAQITAVLHLYDHQR
jgi:hypothetical protein